MITAAKRFKRSWNGAQVLQGLAWSLVSVVDERVTTAANVS